MNTETPQITSSCYASSNPQLGGITFGPADQWQRSFQNVQMLGAELFEKQLKQQQPSETIMPEKSSSRRIVQVFIADPNENVPLDKSVIYTGEQKLTDLNDTELFFEVPIKELLDKHNAYRITHIDKEASKRAGKDILLDPVKIRDLKMVVVTVAQF